MPEEFSRAARRIECGLAFFLLPPCLYWVRHQVAFRIVPLILAIAALCAIHLVRSGGGAREILWSTAGLQAGLRSVLLFWAPSALAMTVVVVICLRPWLFFFPCHTPGTWLATMLLYPPLAALPQELIFRAFFFARYERLFSTRALLIGCNGVGFGLAHALYGNWIAVALSTTGGLLFAYRYHQTRSLLLTSLEHGLWGDFVFTVGIGQFLYSGGIS